MFGLVPAPALLQDIGRSLGLLLGLGDGLLLLLCVLFSCLQSNPCRIHLRARALLFARRFLQLFAQVPSLDLQAFFFVLRLPCSVPLLDQVVELLLLRRVLLSEQHKRLLRTGELLGERLLLLR